MILKTNQVNYSLLDREEILKKINNIKDQVKGNLPNIYLIHGDLTIEEMAMLSKDAHSIFFLSYVNELLITNPEECFGSGYLNPEKKAKLITNLSAKAGEPWISFYSKDAIDNLLSQNGFTIKKNVNLEDLNSLYFDPVGRTLPINEIFKLEHFVVAESYA